jgi:Holliday junction DNA helicase RuvA
MISALTGELRRVDEDRLHLAVGPMLVEMMIPASDVSLLGAATGQEMTFHTILYFEGDAGGGGGLEPRLVGFLRPEDKRFFEKFITVKGIGPKKALKALIYPAGEVAQAIESKDTRFLVGLPQIGKRMAEQIVAELAGKVGEFATAAVGGKMNAAAVGFGRRSELEEDAISTLMALGERRADAEHLLDRARQQNGNLKTTEALVREMLRMRTVRA